MEYSLTYTTQCSKKCRDGKSRNFILYFLNGVQIFKHKLPFDEDYDRGFDKRTHIYDTYLLNGCIHQTREADDTRGITAQGNWGVIKEGKVRQVRFPVSKKKLEIFNIPKDLKIEIQ